MKRINEDTSNEERQREGIFNPLTENFSVTYDINGDGKPKKFTIPAQEIVFFEEKFLVRHIKKHLADKIVQKKDYKPNPEIAYAKAYEEMSVDGELKW